MLRATVVCSMRNEGPFIVEWVTWYRMLGFSGILVVTNDCTDHSPQLLDALQAAGWVKHIRSDLPVGTPVTEAKLALARQDPLVFRANWVLVCDVDEFLVIHSGAGKLPDLLGAGDFDAMAILWRVFGTSGTATWQDGLTHRQFTRAGGLHHPISGWVKMLVQGPRRFARLAEHGPREPIADRVKAPLRLVNTLWQTVPGWPGRIYMRKLQHAFRTHAAAQMNHYMLRSEESWGLKQGTPSAVRGGNRYTDRYYQTANRNESRDLSARRYDAEFDALHAQAMALPGVAALHHDCCADYAARLAIRAGRAPEDDLRWQAHRAQADHFRKGAQDDT